MENKKDFYAQVADKLIEKLKQGTAPWQRPWDAGSHGIMPVNPTTNKRYRGINSLNLMMQERGDPRWLTYKQAEEVNAQVRSGERGTPIVYYKFEELRTVKNEDGKAILDEQGNELKTKIKLEKPKAYISYVFNATQIDGLPELIKKSEQSWNAEERAETILKNSAANIEHRRQPRAFYKPSEDKIVLPEKDQFHSAEGYYSTALHELGHWTGHSSRLNRLENAPFGSQEYAKEELRAEIASFMLGYEIGLPLKIDNHASYVDSWIKVLQEKPEEIRKASADAEKILDYIMGLELQQEQKAVQETVVNKEQIINTNTQKDSSETITSKILTETSTILSQREYLAVPYEERNEAKAAGALWDSVDKSWYIGPNADKEKLQKWQANKPISTVSPKEEFTQVLSELGFKVSGEHPIMDGKTHRLEVEADKNGQQSGFYVVHLNGKPAGYAKNNRSGEEIKWKSQGTNLTPKEKKNLKEQCVKHRQEQSENLALKQEAAAQHILKQIEGMQPVSSPTSYMQSKGLEVHKGAYTKDDGKITCLPAQDAEGKIWTVQDIREDNTKHFAKDCRKNGCFHPVGGMDAVNKAPVLVISEGYSTASSLATSLGFATVAAFDSGNLMSVATALHEKYPDKAILIAGDDDRHLKENPAINKNVGREKAEQVALSVNGKAVFPVFANDETGRDFKDFNDLATKSKLGSQAVNRQLKPIIEQMRSQKNIELQQENTRKKKTI